MDSPPALQAPHLAELLAELRPLVLGSRVREVVALPPGDVMLVLEPQDGEAFFGPDGPPILRLRFSAHPDGARVVLQQGRVHRHDGPAAPFFARVVEELTGARLVALDQVRGDRIALAEFRDTPGGTRRALLLELLGRHANQALLGPGDEVLALLTPQPSRGGRPPRLEPGKPWAPPGGGARAPEGPPPPSLAEVYPEPDVDPPGKAKDRAPLSWRVERALGLEAESALAEDARRKLLQRVKRKLDRARSGLAGLERRRDAAEGAERVLQDGELLKAALGTFERGARYVEVQDWFEPDAPRRRLELDPKLSPQDNVERVFARYHKLEAARATVAEELEQARARLDELEALQVEAREHDDPEALDADAVRRGLLDPLQQADPRKKRTPEKRLPYRTFRARDGSEIRVGRTARDNDELTIRLSKGSDVWLHTADCPGSHVILRVDKGQEPDEGALLDAAFLAVHFSPARGGTRVPVHVARRKLVHKPKGAKPGLVTLSGGRILQVRTQPDVLAALLRQNRRGEDGP